MLDHSIWPILPFLCRVCYLMMLCLLFWHWWRVFRLPKPAKKQPRSNLGPTKPPPCPACQAEDEAQKQIPVPPPPIEQTCGRPREVDTSSHYCPDKQCRYYGWAGLGNIRSNGHPNGGRWRQLQCTVCGKCFMETSNTIFFGKRVPAEIIWRALKALAEGLDIRATARVFEVDPNTVEKWLRQAATHMEAVSQYLIHDLQLTQVQVDELWALLGRQDQDPSQKKRRATRWVGDGAATHPPHRGTIGFRLSAALLE